MRVSPHQSVLLLKKRVKRTEILAYANKIARKGTTFPTPHFLFSSVSAPICQKILFSPSFFYQKTCIYQKKVLTLQPKTCRT